MKSLTDMPGQGISKSNEMSFVPPFYASKDKLDKHKSETLIQEALFTALSKNEGRMTMKVLFLRVDIALIFA